MIIITLARKPMPSTAAQNALALGTGGMNLTACRIPINEELPTNTSIPARRGKREHIYGGGKGITFTRAENMARFLRGENTHYNPLGRWPANVLLSGPAAEDMDKQSGQTQSTIPTPPHVKSQGWGWAAEREVHGFTDAGGASRYFKLVEK